MRFRKIWRCIFLILPVANFTVDIYAKNGDKIFTSPVTKPYIANIRPMGFLCCWPVGLELIAWQFEIEKSRVTRDSFHRLLKTHSFALFWSIQGIRGFTKCARTRAFLEHKQLKYSTRNSPNTDVCQVVHWPHFVSLTREFVSHSYKYLSWILPASQFSSFCWLHYQRHGTNNTYVLDSSLSSRTTVTAFSSCQSSIINGVEMIFCEKKKQLINKSDSLYRWQILHTNRKYRYIKNKAISIHKAKNRLVENWIR